MTDDGLPPVKWFRAGTAVRPGAPFRSVLSAGAPPVPMPADLDEKTDRYERLLDEALDAATVAVPEGTPLRDAAGECEEMARSYLEDGRHFRAEEDLVNALAAFSYGHAWLDAGARFGLFDVPDEGHLFTQ